MDADLTPDQEAEARRIYGALKHSADAELVALARLLASKADGEVFGSAEFAVRDAAHRIGAKAIEAALQGRKKATVFPVKRESLPDRPPPRTATAARTG